MIGKRTTIVRHKASRERERRKHILIVVDIGKWFDPKRLNFKCSNFVSSRDRASAQGNTSWCMGFLPKLTIGFVVVGKKFKQKG